MLEASVFRANTHLGNLFYSNLHFKLQWMMTLEIRHLSIRNYNNHVPLLWALFQGHFGFLSFKYLFHCLILFELFWPSYLESGFSQNFWYSKWSLWPDIVIVYSTVSTFHLVEAKYASQHLLWFPSSLPIGCFSIILHFSPHRALLLRGATKVYVLRKDWSFVPFCTVLIRMKESLCILGQVHLVSICKQVLWKS